MPTPTPSLCPSVLRFETVTLIVTFPASSLAIATADTSGPDPESPAGSPNEPVLAATATPARTSAPPATTASARNLDPSIPARVTENSTNVTDRPSPAARRRRRLACASCLPRAAEELSARGRAAGKCPTGLLQLHHAALGLGTPARSARRLGLARYADVPPRAVRRVPVGSCVRRRPSGAARPAPGARSRIRFRRGEGARLRSRRLPRGSRAQRGEGRRPSPRRHVRPRRLPARERAHDDPAADTRRQRARAHRPGPGAGAVRRRAGAGAGLHRTARGAVRQDPGRARRRAEARREPAHPVREPGGNAGGRAFCRAGGGAEDVPANGDVGRLRPPTSPEEPDP